MQRYFSIVTLLTFLKLSLYAIDNSFILEDQFEKTYQKEDFLGREFIMIGGKLESKDLRQQFIQKVRKKISKDLCIVNIIDMHHVPALLRFYARSKFPQTKSKWLLLDWRGEVSKQYQFKKQGLSVLLFDKTGRMRYRSCETEVDASRIEIIKNKLEAIQ
ncbi:MAG: hypothetical protein K0U47_11885 [Epsilonproteobacteria bacterium]|nr:hypothetical protein [Campylobacterota bacterium]